MLRPWRLESARILGRISGVGPAKLHQIALWRATVARGFAFDPARLVTTADLQQLNGEMAKRRKLLVALLEQGAGILRDLSQRANQHSAMVRARAELLARVAAQAELDRDAPLPS